MKPWETYVKEKDVIVIEQQEHLFAWLAEELTAGDGTASLPPYLATRFKDIMDQLGKSGWWTFEGTRGQYLNELLADAVEAGVLPSTRSDHLVSDFIAETLYWSEEGDNDTIFIPYLNLLLWVSNMLPINYGRWEYDDSEVADTARLWSGPAAERDHNLRVDVVLRATPNSV